MMSKLKAFFKEWYKTLIVFGLSFLAAGIVLHFIKMPLIEGTSMEPNYIDGTRFIMLQTHSVHVNDIVVVWCENLDEYIVKRVIGIGGDKIEIKDDGLYRNNVKLYESYVNEQNWVNNTFDIEIIIPDGEIFVLGDNRNHSNDSRVFGTFKCEDILGRLLFACD